MRAFLILLLLAIAVAIYYGLPKKIDYEPLAEGDVWTLQAEDVLPKGGTQTATLTRTVASPVERGGKTYFTVRLAAPGKQGIVQLIRKDDNGLYSIDPKDPNAKEQQDVMFPIKEGQSWEGFSNGEPVKISVVGLETVTANGKTYEKCFHIQSKGLKSGASEDDWEAPNLGSVKMELHFPNGAKSTLSLIEFKAAK
jgi:hypothetical protein